MVTITLDVDETVEWWRPLVAGLVCVPHLVLNGVATVVSILAWIVTVPIVVVTGRVPTVLSVLQVTVLRERARTFGCLFALQRKVPPYATTLSATDPGDAPATIISVDVATRAVRLAPIARLAVVAPHVLVLVPLGICLDVLYPLLMVLVAINRGWPAGMARTLASIEQWVVEVILFATMATDQPPHFGLAPDREVATA